MKKADNQKKFSDLSASVPKAGIEPAHPRIHDFESCASTSSATLAFYLMHNFKTCARLPTVVPIAIGTKGGLPVPPLWLKIGLQIWANFSFSQNSFRL